jgi:hypothetical protein
MKRDPDSISGGYTSWSYCEALEEGLLPIWRGHDGDIFQQDNAPIHTARRSRQWMDDHGIATINWPPYSPDLNPIENVWRILKARLRRHYPDLHLIMHNQADWERFRGILNEAWEAIPQSQIRGLFDSMERRLRAVIRARGWYTRYQKPD